MTDIPDLDTYVEKLPPPHGSHVEYWLRQHPEIKEQVDRHLLAGTPRNVVLRWLKLKHEFPYHETSLRRYYQDLEAGNAA